jgi:hypothetical protein
MSQLTVIQLPQAHELSGLASPRESDSVLRQYRRANVSNDQQRSMVQEVNNALRKIEKMRRRILGGIGGAAGGWPWMYPDHVEGDSTQSYSAGFCLYLSALNTLVTTGMTDLVSNANAKSCQGVWLAMQDVPAAATVGGVLKWNVPQLPYPTSMGTVAPTGSPLKGDLDNPALYFYYLGDIQ